MTHHGFCLNDASPPPLVKDIVLVYMCIRSLPQAGRTRRGRRKTASPTFYTRKIYLHCCTLPEHTVGMLVNAPPGGNAPVGARRGVRLPVPGILEGGEKGNLALTPAQMTTNHPTRLRAAGMEDKRYTTHSSRMQGAASHNMDGTVINVLMNMWARPMCRTGRHKTVCRTRVLLVEAGFSAARSFFGKAPPNTRRSDRVAAPASYLQPPKGVRVRSEFGLVLADVQG